MRPDDILLVDMLLAARDAIEILGDSSIGHLERDRQRQLAVVKAVEIVGEAASRVSSAFRDAHPDVPWQDIAGMRHRLVHDYFEIDLSRVWETVHDDLPPLITQLERLAPPERD